MATVFSYENSPHFCGYRCSEPGDQSGEYVPAAELERSAEKAEVYGRMAAEANATLGGIKRNERLRDAAIRVTAQRDAALAALEGLLAVIYDSDRQRHPSAMRLLSIVSGRPEFAAVDAARAAIEEARGGEATR